MDSNKIYQSIIELLFNTIKNDKLKYWLYKNKDYKNMFVDLVNDLFTLEKEHNTTYKDQQWATAFGKAIVKITQEKQRIQVIDNKKVEDMYKDYSNFIAYSDNKYEINRNELEKAKVNFTPEEVVLDGKLSAATIKNFDEQYEKIEAERIAKEQAEKAEANKEGTTSGANGANFNQGFQGGNPFENMQQMYERMPVNPMMDPRFYPYDRKPKWMQWAKWILGAVGILAAILLIAANAYAMSVNISFKTTDLGAMSDWALDKDAFANGKLPEGMRILKDLDITLSLTGGNKLGAWDVISYIFFIIPAVYLGMECFRKPRNLREKYRINYWPVVFTVILYGLSIMQIYKYVTVGEMHDAVSNFVKMVTTKESFDQSVFNAWWDGFVSAHNVKGIAILMDIAIAFLGITVVMGIVMAILNPKMDRQKIAKAQYEYQTAIASMMQGQEYTMDQSIYENDEDVIIREKTKFGLWLEKTFKRKGSKNKDK